MNNSVDHYYVNFILIMMSKCIKKNLHFIDFQVNISVDKSVTNAVLIEMTPSLVK